VRGEERGEGRDRREIWERGGERGREKEEKRKRRKGKGERGIGSLLRREYPTPFPFRNFQLIWRKRTDVETRA
jgi:hypothetical protein